MQRNFFSNQQNQLSRILMQYEQLAQSNPVNLRQKIPEKEVWRFFCDLRLVGKKGWLLFEKRARQQNYYLTKHQGPVYYLQGLYSAFNELFKPHSLSTSFIKKLHFHAMQLSHNTEPSFRQENNKIVCYPLGRIGDEINNTSINGLTEFYQNRVKYCSKVDLCIDFNGPFIKLDSYFLNVAKTCFNELYKPSGEVNTKKLKYILLSLNIITKTGQHKNDAANDIITTPSLREAIITLITLAANAAHIDQFTRGLFAFMTNHDFRFYCISSYPTDVSNMLEKRINDLIEQYTTAISTSQNALHKLKTIITFIQQCEQEHPFTDGNCRVFCMLLLSGLLMKNGFPPCIMHDPNQFDMLAINELTSEVIKGMNNTLFLIEHGHLNNITTDSILEQATASGEHVLVEYFRNITNFESANRRIALLNPFKQAS